MKKGMSGEKALADLTSADIENAVRLRRATSATSGSSAS
jgi:hypothetical protein